MENTLSTKLAQELEPLQARIEEVKTLRSPLVKAYHQVEADLVTLEEDRKRYEALQEVRTALGKLDELDAGDLFWGQLPEVINPEDSLERLGRQFELQQQHVTARLGKQKELQAKIQRCNDELAYLEEKVEDAYQREQKRRSEFVVEREVAFFPMHAAVMPWSKETESERYFRRAVLIALLFCFLLGGIVPLVNIPRPDLTLENVIIPERIAKLVREVPVVEEPPPPPKPEEEEKKIDQEKPDKKKPEPDKPKEEKKPVRKKVQNTGVLAFKESFKDLIVDAPAAKVGNIRKTTAKEPTNTSSRRSLVAMQATGTSGGIDASTVSRNLGGRDGGGSSGKKIGAVAFSRVESKVASLEEQSSRKLSSGPKPSRTDEEIQIVFDRYKATLYRIYNKELRVNPTLRGNILLRLTIQPDGSVSACSVESTDLKSPELVKKIVARVKKFNFGPKDNAPKITILYPIDFLPAR